MQIAEPMTMATDYLLGLWSLALSVALFGNFRKSRQRSVLWWAAALAATSLASFAGGTFHGFRLHLSALEQAVLWKMTVYAVGVASLSLLAGSATAYLARPWRTWLLALAGLKFLVYAGWMVFHNDFRYVIYDYAPALVGVLLLAVFAWRTPARESAGWLIGGILTSFLAAGIQQSGVELYRHFNHNDLYHLVQMGAMYLFFQGARRLRDR